MNHLWQDVRYGIRMLMSRPGFTATAVLVLALGIGANSAVFSLVNAFLLKPLQIDQPEQLTGLYSRDTKHPDAYRAFSYPNYIDIRDHNPVFAGVMAHNMAMVGLKEGNTTRRVFADIVSSNYFSTLGVSLLKGRAFLPEEERLGAPLMVIVSYPFWTKNGQDPDLLGKLLTVNGRTFTVIGITPEGFSGTTALVSPELFVPFSAYDLAINDYEGQGKKLASRDNAALIVVGRFRPGITQQAADAQLAVLATQMEKAYPVENKDQTLMVRPLSRLNVSTDPSDDSGMRVPAVLLLSLSAVVLLIASLNLANMMMAKGSARTKEIAIRLAIGGGRRQIVQQLLTEGLLLAIMGGIAGLFVASWSITLLLKSLIRVMPFSLVYDSRPDARVLLVTVGFCAISTMVFALLPAWKLSRPDIWINLKEKIGGDVVSGGRHLFSRRNLLVMAQLSLSLMMLAAAGLFVRSAMHAANVDPGFAFENRIIAEVDPSLINYNEVRGRQVYQTLQDRLRLLPGVEAVSLAATVPFGMINLGKGVTDATVPKDHKPLNARFNIVTADYFQTLGIPLLRGRAFTQAEMLPSSKSRVVLLDKLAAAKLWPNGSPLGKRVRLDTSVPDYKVVGIVGDTREHILGGTVGGDPHVFVPFGQQYQANMQIHLKFTGTGPDAENRMLEAVRREIRAVDDRLPLLALKTMRGHLESSMDLWIVRTGAHMLEIFGGVALFLAMVGLYAVNAYTVSRRTREIGIRMALGADRSATLRMILTEGLRVTAVGLGVGLLLALALGQLLAGLLYEVGGADPIVLVSAPALLAAVALLACYIPARRAARVDPMVALRYE